MEDLSKEPSTKEVMKVACRMGAELGVDFIKTVYVPPKEEYREVIENCFVPVLGFGGPAKDDSRSVLEYVKDAMDAGCNGFVMGRNISRHKVVTGMVKALMKIIHEGSSVTEALKEINEK